MRARVVIPILALLALAGLSGTASADDGNGGRSPNIPVDLPETDEEKAELAGTVCQCVAELEQSGVAVTGETLRACVLDRWWPTTDFPPIAADPQSVKDAFALTSLYVQAYLDDPEAFIAQWCGPDLLGPTEAEFKPTQPTIPGGIQPPAVDFGEGGASTPGYPWETPLIHKGGDGKHAPTPGMFYIVNKSNSVPGLDTMLEIARYALGSAYAMAGAPRSLPSIPAEEVLAYLALIACSPWNDTAYGTSNEGATGGTLGLGPHGRGINMFPRHHNNIAALVQGTKPQRATFIDGSKDEAVGGENNSWPQLWLPPINLDMLRDFGVVTTQGFEWSTGDSVLVPPPAVWAHGVFSRIAPPGSGFWGC